MRNKSVLSEAKQIALASELIELGARLQLLETETALSRERLVKLYKEIRGVSPPKGMLPFSSDWFVTWRPNIHASLFIDIHRYLVAHAGARGIEALIRGYRLYLEHLEVDRLERVLSLTRAWTLLRFIDGGLLQTVPCTLCGGHFVVRTLELYADYACGLCKVPSRAGKAGKPAAASAHDGQSLRAA